MSKADELLRELLAATDELEGTPIEYGVAMRIGYAQKAARAYLNEKPHEPLCLVKCPACGERLYHASPPHAAAVKGRIRVGEFNCECPECGMHWSRWDDERHEAGCPNAPHAAAEPEKPELSISEMDVIGDVAQAWAHRPVRQAQELYLAGKRASLSAQPIAREPRVQITAEIADERERQVSVEDWSPAHDDAHDEGALAAAAASYALSGAAYSAHPAWKIEYTKHARAVWPFDDEFAKPKDARRDLIRAAALIVAEIERLDRAALKSAGKDDQHG